MKYDKDNTQLMILIEEQTHPDITRQQVNKHDNSHNVNKLKS